MMCNDSWHSGLRPVWQATVLVSLLLGLAACNSDDFIIPPSPSMAQDMMSTEDEAMEDEAMEDEAMMMADAVVMAAAQSSLGCASVANTDGVRLRTGPGTDFPVLGLAYVDEALPMQGLSRDKSWVAVTAHSGDTAYIAVELADTMCPAAPATQ